MQCSLILSSPLVNRFQRNLRCTLMVKMYHDGAGESRYIGYGAFIAHQQPGFGGPTPRWTPRSARSDP